MVAGSGAGLRPIGEVHFSAFEVSQAYGPLSLSIKTDWMPGVICGPGWRAVPHVVLSPPCRAPSGVRVHLTMLALAGTEGG